MLSRSYADVTSTLSRMSEESEKSSESMSSNQVFLEERKIQLEDLIRRTEESSPRGF